MSWVRFLFWTIITCVHIHSFVNIYIYPCINIYIYNISIYPRIHTNLIYIYYQIPRWSCHSTPSRCLVSVSIAKQLEREIRLVILVPFSASTSVFILHRFLFCFLVYSWTVKILNTYFNFNFNVWFPSTGLRSTQKWSYEHLQRLFRVYLSFEFNIQLYKVWLYFIMSFKELFNWED